MFHRVEITKEMLEKAKKRDCGAYNSMSFLGGGGNVTGFLGEYMFHSICPHFEHVDSFDHDFECNGITVDVKSKNQNVTHEPKGYYEGSVTVKSFKFQHPDWYVFCRLCRVKGEFAFGWVLGKISYDRLMRDGRRVSVGDDEGNMQFKADNINIRYDQLDPVNIK